MGERHGGGGRFGRVFHAAVCWLLAFVCAVSAWVPGGAFGDEAASDEAPSAAASSEAVRTVRVAFPQQFRVMWTDESGVRSGYTYEYLERIAQYTGWNYEFVAVEGSGAAAFEKSRELLAAGEVDLVAGIMSSEQSRSSLALTRESYATLGIVLLASAERTDNPLVSASADRPLRVAAVEKSTLLGELESFCARMGIAYELVNCADVDDSKAAALDGRADAVLATDMAAADGLRTVGHVSSHPLYFAAAQGDQGLADKLDAALERIDSADPMFRSRLHDEYFTQASGAFVLSDDDRSFIAAADPVRVGVLSNQPPYQYEENGELKGIAVDLLEVVAAKTGLNFTYVPAASEDELDGLTEQGVIDLVACFDYNYAAARERGLSLTQPYVTASYVLVANEGASNGDIAGKRLAISSSSRYDGMFIGDAVRFPSVAECLQAVVGGEADYTYVDEYVMQYFLNMPEYRGVRVAPQTHEPRRVSFGVVRTGDGRLLGIMDQAIGSLTEVELQAVINGDVLRERPFEIVDFVRAHPLETFATAAVVLLIVLLLILVILYQRARANAKTALDLKKRLRLYALSDDYFFEYDKRTGSLVISLPSKEGQHGVAEPITVNLGSDSFALDEEQKTSFVDLLRSRERRVEEVRLPDADGIDHWLRVTVEPVDDAGRAAYAVGTLKVIDEERSEKDELMAKAERDSLTGLLNSETTRRRIAQQMDALGEGERGALIMVDIDRFKEVNDTFGHLEGDHALVDVARILRESFRVGDVVGRLGGDEFMVYLNNVKDSAVVKEKCEAVRRAVERRASSDSERRITISTGSALSKPGESFDDLYRRADEALYAAKRDGRNRCSF